MARPRLTRPTDAELQILAVLWRRGAGTVRDIHEELRKLRRSGYNSTLKLVQIMTDKGYVRRDMSRRPQVYSAVLGEQQTKKQLLRDLADRVFGGSVADLIEHASLLKRGSEEAPRRRATATPAS